VELNSREVAIIAWEDSLAASERALGRAYMERDVERAKTEVVRQDYLSKLRTLTSCTKHSLNVNKMLEEHQILLSLQKNDLNVQEATLAQGQACGL
jgi:hypothetical protein